VGPSSAFCIALAKVYIVAGPTASGKSALAKKLAQEKNGVILNGDSLQVYRGLEILTDQPSPEDQKEFPHRLYGFLDPGATWSAGKWISLLLPEIEAILKGGRTPIVVGGTGLYLKTLSMGMSPLPPVDPEVRKGLQAEERSQDSLYDELQTIDPELAGRIDPHDSQRTLRGLEVFHGTGKPLSFWQSQKPIRHPYEFEKILLMPPKEEVELRVIGRLEDMLAKGVLEEVSRVLALSPSVTAMKAIGLRELGSYLNGECSLDEAKKLILFHTRQYAKRQRTWFRHQFEVGEGALTLAPTRLGKRF
jgi:tRNA dimethylallyltransferase